MPRGHLSFTRGTKMGLTYERFTHIKHITMLFGTIIFTCVNIEWFDFI